MAAKSMRDNLFSKLRMTLLMTMAIFLLGAPIKIVANGVGSGGVWCSNQIGHITMLNLNASLYFPSMPLRGKLNPSLIELKYLSYLDVSNNDFNQSQILEFIVFLSNLRHLNLFNANFGRNIHFQLGNLSNLQYLDLSWNHFNKP